MQNFSNSKKLLTVPQNLFSSNHSVNWVHWFRLYNGGWNEKPRVLTSDSLSHLIKVFENESEWEIYKTIIWYSSWRRKKKIGPIHPFIQDFPDGASGEECTRQRRRHKRHEFIPWVRKIPRRRKWQPTPVFLPGKSHGQMILAGCSPWGHKRCVHSHTHSFTLLHHWGKYKHWIVRAHS